MTLSGQFGDTTYTKVFVGGLAWETQKETMKKYFEQFGDILEAVVITDKATGRSKGYGFVTFREAEAAMRACVDAAPVIDGRRANCNLASMGVQRSKPTTPKHGGGGRNLRVMSGFHGGFQTASGLGTAFPSATTFPHYAIQQGIPYNIYGYSPYSPDYTYPTGYYSVYGGGSSQYGVYGSAATASGVLSSAAAAFYPYMNFGEGNGNGCYTPSQGYGVQYPHQFFPYSAAAAAGPGYPTQHYGTPISLAPSPALHSGVTMTLRAPIPHH
ncbi:hypothetical protein RDI58_027145 [Solanum bulbocastanum]|uniref:RRM domain-containing protein n=1 Tax=Solanum bulbocastanum TaxID=147425 RepID=A0AAN8SVH3_SOLBU